MRPKDQAEAARINAALTSFHNTKRPLPGIQDAARRAVFLEQLFESIHRVRYITRGVLERELDVRRANPASDLFDPIKGAAIRAKQGQHDEACWLVFLSVHFGRHRWHGWQYARDVYGALGNGSRWDWVRIRTEPEAFRRWLAANQGTLGQKGSGRIFGSHRKYQSIDAMKPNGTGSAFVSYVNWVHPPRTHAGLMENAVDQVGNDPRELFGLLYQNMDSVASFGRTAKFDYLTMLGKLGLAPHHAGKSLSGRGDRPTEGCQVIVVGRNNSNRSKHQSTRRLGGETRCSDWGRNAGTGRLAM